MCRDLHREQSSVMIPASESDVLNYVPAGVEGLMYTAGMRRIVIPVLLVLLALPLARPGARRSGDRRSH